VSFEAFTAVMFQVEVFWVVTPCNVVVGYQRFGGSCCLDMKNVLYQKSIYEMNVLCSNLLAFRINVYFLEISSFIKINNAISVSISFLYK